MTLYYDILQYVQAKIPVSLFVCVCVWGGVGGGLQYIFYI